MKSLSRRNFMGATASAVAAFHIVPSHVLGRNPPSSKLNLAFVGSGGRARRNMDGLKSENIVALCDVDDQRASQLYRQSPSRLRPPARPTIRRSSGKPSPRPASSGSRSRPGAGCRR